MELSPDAIAAARILSGESSTIASADNSVATGKPSGDRRAPDLRMGFGNHTYDASALTIGLPPLQSVRLLPPPPRSTAATTPRPVVKVPPKTRPSSGPPGSVNTAKPKPRRTSIGKSSSKSLTKTVTKTVLKPLRERPQPSEKEGVGTPVSVPRANPRPARQRFRPLEYWSGERVVYGPSGDGAPFASVCNIIVVERDE